jgi:hypothetical protein
MNQCWLLLNSLHLHFRALFLLKLPLFWPALPLLCASCGVDTKYGGNEVSASVAESRQLGVLVQPLQPDKAGLAVGDTPVVALQEAWLERCWTNAKGEDAPHIIPGLQLVLVWRAGQELPRRYRAYLPPGQTFWQRNQQLYLPLEDTVRRAR